MRQKTAFLTKQLVIVIMALFIAVPITAYADDETSYDWQIDTEYKDVEGYREAWYAPTKRWGILHQGGCNTYRGLPVALNWYSVNKMESLIRNSGEYVLINTQYREVSESDATLFFNGTFGLYLQYKDCIIEDKKGYKLYVNRLLFYDIVNNLKENIYFDIEDADMLDYLLLSTVVIDYYVPTYDAMIGMIDDYDDALDEGSWIQIYSPINTVITLQNYNTGTIYQFPIEADTTIMHKIRPSLYYVSNINGLPFKSGTDEPLSNNGSKNTINTSGDFPKERPYIINLTQIVLKYNIQGVDASYLALGDTNKHPFVAYFEEEQPITEYKKEGDNSKGVVIFFVVFGIVCVGLCIYILKKKPDEDEGE